MRRLAFAATLVALGYAGTVPAASAAPPERTHISYGGVAFPVEGLCPFVITNLVLVGEADQTTYFDSAGRITMVHIHIQQQDALSANGHTLVGDPYTASITLYYDESGNVTSMVFSGVLQKITLPDGRLFIGAGRANVDPFLGIALAPDHGATQNLDALCAALGQ